MVELQVTNSPFNQEQVELLNRLIPTLTDGQRLWLGGYIAAYQAGLATAQTIGQVGQNPVAAPVSAPAVSREVTVLYGSQTGNSIGLSKNSVRSWKNRDCK